MPYLLFDSDLGITKTSFSPTDGISNSYSWSIENPSSLLHIMSKLFRKQFRILQTLLYLFTKGRINNTPSAALLFWWKFPFNVFLKPLLHLHCFVVRLHRLHPYRIADIQLYQTAQQISWEIYIAMLVLKDFMTINIEMFADTCASHFKTGQPILKQVDWL